MKNQVQLFKFHKSEVRTAMINGKPYFVGRDVAKALGYKRIAKAISDHVDDRDIMVSKLGTKKGEREAKYISESGMYSLIMVSKLDSAKEFQHWVTNEVLPSLRQNGSYQLKPMSTAQTLKLLAETSQDINNRVEALEDGMRMSSVDEFRIQKMAKIHVMDILGGNNTQAYKKLARRTFSAFWHDFKKQFMLPRYSDLPKAQVVEAKNFIVNWKPNAELEIAINALNNQKVVHA